jgi:hypothetical protein
MALSKHGILEDPKKSPYNYEAYDSLLELNFMQRMEADPAVRRWMKRHTITIPWIDAQKHNRRYHPDFLVEHTDGTKALIEVKDPTRVDSDDVLRKRRSAEMWCKRRDMRYIIQTVALF